MIDQTKKLPVEFKAKWIAALRSGEYAQGKKFLYNVNTNTFCCLGVCGVINGISLKILGSASLYSNTHEDNRTVYEAAVEILPDILLGNTTNELVETLTNMNDIHNYSFPQIADWIEENL